MPRLLHLTDLHIKPQSQDTLVGIYPDLNLQAVLAEAHRKHGPFDLMLITGDLAQDPCIASYQRIRDMLSLYPEPTLCLPGNHDDNALMQSILNQPPLSCATEMILGEWHIVTVNTQKPGSTQGWISPEAMQRLTQALQPPQPTLLAMHHHCLSTGSPWMDRMKIENADALLSVLARHEHCKLVVHGHVHQELYWWYAGTSVLSTPATAVQFAALAQAFKVTQRPPAYRIIELETDGRWHSSCHFLDSLQHQPNSLGQSY